MHPIDAGDLLLVLARFVIVMFVIYGCVACCLMILKTLINGAAVGLGMIFRTKLGMASIAGGVIYVVFLALKGWAF